MLSGQLGVSLNLRKQTPLDLSNVSYPIKYEATVNLANGVGSYQANEVFTDIRTLDASASENLDLYGGLTNEGGATINFVRIKQLAIFASDTNVNDVIVGAHATAAFADFFGDASDSVKVKPGGNFVVTAPGAGYIVSATSADMLKIANGGSGTSVDYKIFLVGVV